MKEKIKNIATAMFSVFALVLTITVTSCSKEELTNVNFLTELERKVINLESPMETKVVSESQNGSQKTWRLNDGQVVNGIAVGDNIKMDLDEIREGDEKDGATTVDLKFSGKTSFGETIRRSLSYVKMVPQRPDTIVIEPEPIVPDTIVKTDTIVIEPDPYIIREYFVADTTMIHKRYKGESKECRVSMEHKLYWVQEWNTSRKDSTLVWNKKFIVAKTYFAETGGNIFSRTAAKDVQHSSSISFYTSSEESDENFTISRRQGEFVYVVDYVNDAGYRQKGDYHIALEESTVKCVYQDYEAVYNFQFTNAFVGQTEENLGLEDQTLSNYTYQYEANTVSYWQVALSGTKLDTHKVSTEVYRYYE